MAAFIAAIVGGFNQVRGAIVGGLLLGVARQSFGRLPVVDHTAAPFRC